MKELSSDVIKTIRIGIIGSGGIAHAHINQYKKLANVQIVGEADVCYVGRSSGYGERPATIR
jgi:predicted dehydrogenase